MVVGVWEQRSSVHVHIHSFTSFFIAQFSKSNSRDDSERRRRRRRRRRKRRCLRQLPKPESLVAVGNGCC
jgi:hypothetical protein